MKINQTSKFIPNPFYHSVLSNEDYNDDQSKAKTPFQEITNTSYINRKNNYKKNRQLRQFINDEEIQPYSNIQHQQNFEILQQNGQDAEIVQNENFKSEKKCMSPKLNLLLDFDYEENSDQIQQQNQQLNQTPKKLLEVVNVDIPLVSRHLDKQTLIDWSNSSENEGHQTVKIVQQDKSEVINEKQKDEIKIIPTIEEIKMSIQTVFQKIKPATKIQCLMRRDKQNINGVPEYNVYFQRTLKHILTVRKQGMWQYCFYLRDNVPGGKFNYLKIATMQSSFLGNKFTLIKHKQKYSQMTVCYDTNILGLSGPRRLQIYLPNAKIPYEYLNECYDDIKWSDKIQKCVSKMAKWNQKFKSYVLNLHGRASQSSIKNFVITDVDQLQQNSFIIFGKAGTDVYNLDIERPFSIIQGVATAITSFERKLTCD